MSEFKPNDNNNKPERKTLTHEEFEEMLRNHTFILPEEMFPPIDPVLEDDRDIDDQFTA
jgi:hypothetical protein